MIAKNKNKLQLGTTKQSNQVALEPKISFPYHRYRHWTAELGDAIKLLKNNANWKYYLLTEDLTLISYYNIKFNAM